jgi:hypothetical protein
LPPHAGAFLRRALAQGYNHAFAASELKRLHGLDTTRWSVRRFARAEGFARETNPVRIPAHTRRWQRLNIGELWQLDATPHPWFGPDHPAQPLFDMIDDASRLQVGIRLCRSETTGEYILFFKDSFEIHGLPLAVYVDNAAFFRSPKDGALTALGARLWFYGVSLIFATTPQSKGKIERIHQVWQDRLPSFFRLNNITPTTDLGHVNTHLESLALHRNVHELHREIGMRPRSAWDAAREAGRSVLRPVPRDAWWPYVWSLWRKATVGDRGRVHHGELFFPTRLAAGEKVLLCEHGGGHFSVLKNFPAKDQLPAVAFTNRPQNNA